MKCDVCGDDSAMGTSMFIYQVVCPKTNCCEHKHYQLCPICSEFIQTTIVTTIRRDNARWKRHGV